MAAAPEMTDRWRHVPEELRSRRQWVVWRWVDRGGKRTKQPFRGDAPATEASATDPGTWCGFDVAAAAASSAPGVAGVGYVFAPDDPYCGIDFDHCLGADGELAGWASRWLRDLKCYQEVSPSGTGVKVIVRASVARGRKTGKLGDDGSGGCEVYSSARFFTVTGDVYDSEPIDDRQAIVEALLAQVFPPLAERKAKAGQPRILPLLPDDDALVDRARSAKNGEKFRALYDRGDWQSHYPSRSEADAGLCQMIAFWTGPDPDRIDRIFRRSSLMRSKWDEARGDYTIGERAIDHALSHLGEHFGDKADGRRHDIRGGGFTVDDREEKPADIADAADASQEVEDEWLPPRLGKEAPPEPFPIDVFPPRLQSFVREAARSLECPPDYIAAPMLAAAGGVIGMSVNVEVKAHYSEAPNLFLAVVGPPGTKKSPALKAVCRPLEEIDRRNKAIYDIDKAKYERDKAEHQKGQVPPTPPAMTELVLDDATREAVASVHGRNLRGVVMVKGELVAWVSSLNQFKAGGKGDDKQFWLKVYSGEMVKVNRKGPAAAPSEPIVIPRPCVTIVGCLTPDMLPAIRDDKRDDGWLDRILFAYPEPIFADEWTEEEISGEAMEDWSQVVRRLWDRKQYADAEQGRLRPFYVGMTDAAKVRWRQFIKEHRAELRHPEAAPFRGPWSKLEGACARLALILCLVESACDCNDGPPPPVGADHVHNAARLVAYFKDHFKRARLAIVRRDADGGHEAELILGWLERAARRSAEEASGTGFPALFAGRGFSWFSDRDVARQFTRWDDYQQSAGINWLIARRCIRRRQPDPRPQGHRGPRHGSEYAVNPHLLATWNIKETSAASAMSAEIRAAADWLRERLSAGRSPSRDVLDDADRAGIDPVDILEAVKVVGAERINTPGGVAWGMPAQQESEAR